VEVVGDIIVWWRWVGIGVMLPLAQQWLLPLLLLIENVDGAL
jgi:hypothetical protein